MRFLLKNSHVHLLVEILCIRISAKCHIGGRYSHQWQLMALLCILSTYVCMWVAEILGYELDESDELGRVDPYQQVPSVPGECSSVLYL